MLAGSTARDEARRRQGPARWPAQLEWCAGLGGRAARQAEADRCPAESEPLAVHARQQRPGYAPPYGTRRLAPGPRWRYIPAIQSAGRWPRWHPVEQGRAVRARRPHSDEAPGDPRTAVPARQRPAARTAATGAGRQRRYAPVIRRTVRSPGDPHGRGRAGLARRPPQ